jgi:hypothetical protein
MFHLDVAYAYNAFHVFLQVFRTHVSSVTSFFFCMLHLDVSKVDQVLHMGCTWEAASGVGLLLAAGVLGRKPDALGARSSGR